MHVVFQNWRQKSKVLREKSRRGIVVVIFLQKLTKICQMLPSMPILFTRESQDAFGNKIVPSTSYLHLNNPLNTIVQDEVSQQSCNLVTFCEFYIINLSFLQCFLLIIVLQILWSSERLIVFLKYRKIIGLQTGVLSQKCLPCYFVDKWLLNIL